MGRVCTVCSLKDGRRAAIDAAIVAGEANRRLATQYGVSECAVRRHAAAHIPQALARAQDVREVASADTLLEQLRSLQAKALSILAAAEEAGELRTAIAAIREARGNLELLAKLLDKLPSVEPVNVVVTYVAREHLMSRIEDPESSSGVRQVPLADLPP